MTNELKRRVIEGAIERIESGCSKYSYSCGAVFNSARYDCDCSLDDSWALQEEYARFHRINPYHIYPPLEAMLPDQAKQKRIEMLKEFLASLKENE